MFIRCFLEIKFADMQLISLEKVTYIISIKIFRFQNKLHLVGSGWHRQ